jgi:hypothetical protein
MKNLLVVAILLAACGPKKQLEIADIPKLKDLGEVMSAQAQAMDPLFKKTDQASFADAEWVMIADSAARVQATAAKVKESFGKGGEFDRLDLQLADQARRLADAAQAKNAADAGKLLGEMKATCKACHKKFR